jgi:hypothetical protein
VVGGGPWEAEVTRAVAQRTGRVIYLERLSQGEIRDMYCATDCAIVPSRFDDWSTVVNEAICSLTPVRASSGAHASFDLAPPETIFREGSLDSLRCALQTAFNSPRNWEALFAAQQWYLSEWSQARAADCWEDGIVSASSPDAHLYRIT